jgi:transcriptional regulator with XRE-family HTH domain
MSFDNATTLMKLGWHIGDVVRKIREDLGWKQNQLAKLAHVHVTTIGRFENTGSYEPETAEKIASALSLRVADLHAAIPESTADLPDDLFERLIVIRDAKRAGQKGGRRN